MMSLNLNSTTSAPGKEAVPVREPVKTPERKLPPPTVPAPMPRPEKLPSPVPAQPLKSPCMDPLGYLSLPAREL